MSRPQRMKIYHCRFMIPTQNDVDLCVQIVPVIALSHDHAFKLVWSEHAKFIMAATDWSESKSKDCLRKGLEEITNNDMVLSDKAYCSKTLRTLI